MLIQTTARRYKFCTRGALSMEGGNQRMSIRHLIVGRIPLKRWQRVTHIILHWFRSTF